MSSTPTATEESQKVLARLRPFSSKSLSASDVAVSTEEVDAKIEKEKADKKAAFQKLVAKFQLMMSFVTVAKTTSR
ncbi:hypothetical protein L5515_009622 [Caenorhabditis briggsae]|uniref:Uncharacterized protein n=1 Tax=Caenorhabditis briggsae TaxID=6238 RepID=A0AAE9FAD2_CAEBR|nr:hypothetical protein L5515_009622 [Caenorhabditis briggsae]